METIYLNKVRVMPIVVKEPEKAISEEDLIQNFIRVITGGDFEGYMTQFEKECSELIRTA